MRPSSTEQVSSSESFLEDREMRRINNSTECFGPAAAFTADMARVRVRASYLGSRWAQAPISDRPEADT